MSCYICTVYDGGSYYSGCMLHTYNDKIFIRFFFKTWTIPHETITGVYFKKRRVGIERQHRYAKEYMELFVTGKKKFKRELEKLGKPIIRS